MQLILDWVLCLASITASIYLLVVLKRYRWLEYKIYKTTLMFYLNILIINIMYSYVVFISNTYNDCPTYKNMWLFNADKTSIIWQIAGIIYNTCLFIIPFDYFVIQVHNNCDLFECLSKLDDFIIVSIFQRKNQTAR